MREAQDVATVELKVAESPVGRIRMRVHEQAPDAAILRLLNALIASEVERIRAPVRASEEARAALQQAGAGSVFHCAERTGDDRPHSDRRHRNA